MFLLQLLKVALRSLQANLLRSLLAVLGVVIGVAAVIAAMSIIQGAQREIKSSISSMGTNVLLVVPGAAKSRGRTVGSVETLKLEDAQRIMTHCEAALRAAPEIVVAMQTVKFFNKNIGATVLATTDDYTTIRNHSLTEGRFFGPQEIKAEEYVAVLGSEVAKELFGQASPLGFTVSIKNKPFVVIGVLESKGTTGWENVDERVVIPVTTAMKRLYGLRSVQMIAVQARDATQTDECLRQIKRLLRRQHRIAPGKPDDFQVLTQEQFLEQFSKVTNIFKIVLYSIAGISLVVGGIGIMNIMLVSVTERTREIGIRMAVGARRGDILTQFLAESSMISVVGGCIGLGVGVLFSIVIEDITNEIIKTFVPASAVIMALTVATFTGIISGLYPAWKAAELDPIDALRYE